MKLSDFIKDNPTQFAKKHGFPIPVITRFLNGERGLSFETAIRIVAATGGEVTYEDLVAEMAERRSGRRAANKPDNSREAAEIPPGI